MPFASPLFGALGPSLPGIRTSGATGSLAPLSQLSQLTALGRLAGLAGMTSHTQNSLEPDITSWGAMVEVRWVSMRSDMFEMKEAIRVEVQGMHK